MTKQEIQNKALNNATTQNSTMNYEAIINGFMEKGIAQEDIIPRINVFTYNAWKALGRQVRKGEKGVKVVTFVPTTRTDENGEKVESKFSRTTTVFHVSQTDPVKGDDKPESDEKAAPAAPAAPAKPEPVAKNSNSAYLVGDILYTSWGYEQTNVDFYQVIGKKGKSTLVLQEIHGKNSYDNESMTGVTSPSVNDFSGDAFTCRISQGGYVKAKGQLASPVPFEIVEGAKVYKPQRYSSYA